MMNRNAIAQYCMGGNVFLMGWAGGANVPLEECAVLPIFFSGHISRSFSSLLRTWFTDAGRRIHLYYIPLRLPYTRSFVIVRVLLLFVVPVSAAGSHSTATVAPPTTTTTAANITTRHRAAVGLLALRIFFFSR